MSGFSQSHNTRRLFLAALLLGGVLSFVPALSTLASSGSPARSVAALASTRPARLPAVTTYLDYLPGLRRHGLVGTRTLQKGATRYAASFPTWESGRPQT